MCTYRMTHSFKDNEKPKQMVHLTHFFGCPNPKRRIMAAVVLVFELSITNWKFCFSEAVSVALK